MRALPEGELMSSAQIRVGIGGWTFEPWRNNFYPAGWPKARELEYASRQLNAIEINSTYYWFFYPQILLLHTLKYAE